MAATTVIIGGGLAGISAAMHLRCPHRVFEREGRLGGLARTESRDGFYFDCTGHWLHLRTPYMRQQIQRFAGDQLVEVQRRAEIYSHGVFTRYPFQGNLHGLPADVVNECLIGVIQAHLRRDAAGSGEPRNFAEYVEHHFGSGIAKHFMLPYNEKLWGVPATEITSAWCSRFVPKPNLEQIVAGAVGAGPPELGYNVRFLYPRSGGIETVTRALVAQLDPRNVSLDSAVEEIDTEQRTVRVGGETLGYQAIIASTPLPALIGMLRQAPDEVTAAAARLRATPVRYLNVATRTKAPADYHWLYVPEKRLPFYRVGVFSNAMPSMAPRGCSSLYVELADRAPVADTEALVADALRALVEVRAINATDDVVFADLRQIDPAYVIFDEAYEAALAVIHPYLEARRIFATGRYGAWIYNAMEDSLMMGKQVAERVDSLRDSGGAAQTECS